MSACIIMALLQPGPQLLSQGRRSTHFCIITHLFHRNFHPECTLGEPGTFWPVPPTPNNSDSPILSHNSGVRREFHAPWKRPVLRIVCDTLRGPASRRQRGGLGGAALGRPPWLAVPVSRQAPVLGELHTSAFFLPAPPTSIHQADRPSC